MFMKNKKICKWWFKMVFIFEVLALAPFHIRFFCELYWNIHSTIYQISINLFLLTTLRNRNKLTTYIHVFWKMASEKPLKKIKETYQILNDPKWIPLSKICINLILPVFYYFVIFHLLYYFILGSTKQINNKSKIY